MGYSTSLNSGLNMEVIISRMTITDASLEGRQSFTCIKIASKSFEACCPTFFMLPIPHNIVLFKRCRLHIENMINFSRCSQKVFHIMVVQGVVGFMFVAACTDDQPSRSVSRQTDLDWSHRKCAH